MGKRKHTKGRLRVAGRGERGTQRLPIFNERGKTIAGVYADGGIADAHRLVNCWNAHDDLLGALEQLTESVTDERGVAVAMVKACAVIAKVREEK